MKLLRHLFWIVLLFAAFWAGCGFFIGRATAHDSYHQWLSQHAVKCCSDLDKECRPVRSDYDFERGVYIILINGRWLDVPPGAVLTKIESPDGSSHACISKTSGTIDCFVNGKPKS